MAEDSKCFSALSIGYTLGQTSPSTVGITDLIKEKIDGSVKTLNAQMSTTLDKTDKDMRKAVADFSTCLAAGKGMKGGKCVPAPWAVSADSTLACDATRDGSLKYDKANTALLICVGSTKQWTRVSPPNPPDLGAFAASAGEDCATIKKKGYSAGSKFYWTKPGGKAALVFCNMKGDGTTEFDGSSKDKPATSCRTIDKYYDALSTTAALKWIKTKGGAIQVICVIANGGVLSFGDGKTKETAAFSCQQILDKFKNLKNNDKRWLIFNKQGSNVASLIQCTSAQSTRTRARGVGPRASAASRALNGADACMPPRGKHVARWLPGPPARLRARARTRTHAPFTCRLSATRYVYPPRRAC